LPNRQVGAGAQQAVLRCAGRFNISGAVLRLTLAAGRPAAATRERSANQHHSIQFGAAASDGAETDAELHKQAYTGENGRAWAAAARRLICEFLPAIWLSACCSGWVAI
jgi:hypothetical protein